LGLLQQEKAEKEYYRDLLLTKLNVIGSISQDTPIDDFEPIRKRVPLSLIRRELEANAHKIAAEPARNSELTEAEKVFQESLNHHVKTS
jgi:hypothetical protein